MDAESGIVCYGMLESIHCQFLRDKLPNKQHLVGRNDEYFELCLFDNGTRITVGTMPLENAAFAQLNTATTSALAKLSKLPCIDFTAYASRRTIEILLAYEANSNSGSKSSARFELNINILGLELNGDAAGDVLGEQGLSLQKPVAFADGYSYQNPHIWSFDDIPDIDIWLAGLTGNVSVGEQMAAQQGWSQVLDDLSAFDVMGLDAARVDLDTSRLTAELLKHQTDALRFMTSRESGSPHDALRYWRSGTDETGTIVYRHTVTATERRERPFEPASGILADDMGLGKTLSTIALISTSKDRSEAFPLHRGMEQMSHGILTPTKATLVVVPSLLILEEWKKEVEKHTSSGSLRIAKYHGHDRVSTANELRPFDIVLTTYGTVSTEYRRSYQGGREVLYYLRWFRVVLDEAHTIRSARTAQCKAILALYAKHHWCLTGTPISNKVEDLAPLLRFCRVPQLQDPAEFREHVAKVTRKSFRQGCNVLRQVLGPVCLRRTKALLHLPQPRTVDHVVEFSAAELERHSAIFRHSRRRLDAAVSGNRDAKSTILQAILQLRIFCNQGTFMPNVELLEEEAHLDPDEALTLLQEEGQATCASCSTEVVIINQERDSSSGVLGICSHILCSVCRATAFDDPARSAEYRCPQCNDVFTEKVLSDQREAPKAATHTSAKLERLLDDLQSSNGKEKSIVFSVWRKTLDVAAQLCQDAGILHVRIDGTVPQDARHQALEKFTTDATISTLLMTLGTGALGLNLTAATRVHILEPQWNPSVEKQAIGRVVRMGQERNASIIRYSVRDSVEQQIQTYQRRKMQLAAGGFSDGASHSEYESRILTATFFTEAKLQ